MPKVTYRDVRRLLIELGFAEKPVHGSHLVYKHPSGPLLSLPRRPPTEIVMPTLWHGIRRTIVEAGISREDEIERILFRRSA